LELILIDSGLVNKVGHHYMLDKAVSGALARQKLRYRIFAQRGITLCHYLFDIACLNL
jgi:hypothetical protein